MTPSDVVYAGESYTVEMTFDETVSLASSEAHAVMSTTAGEVTAPISVSGSTVSFHVTIPVGSENSIVRVGEAKESDV